MCAPKGDMNRFTYQDDPNGVKCPIGAHIRRANPRTTDYQNQPSWLIPRLFSQLGGASLGQNKDIMASSRFHRVLRRGREFGKLLTPADAVRDIPADDK